MTARGHVRGGALILLGALIAGLPGLAEARDQPFTLSNLSLTLNGPRSIEAADLDGDGDLDLITAALVADSVHWWDNVNGDGSSWVQKVIDTNLDAAIDAVPADMDGDGDLDVLATAFTDDDVVWYENTASDASAWTKRTIESSFNGAQTVVAYDMDRDGDLDAVATANVASDVAWWENTAGNGTAWSKHAVDNSLLGARTVDVADMDDDGDPDLIVSAEDADKLVWYENTNGAATSWTMSTIATGVTEAWGLVVADMDRDGDLDVVASGEDDNEVAWWENANGQATSWTKHSIVTNLIQAGAVEVYDVDRDGDLDVFGVGLTSDEVRWWENDGTAGSFIEHIVISGYIEAYAVTPADLDGDGDVDLAGVAGTADDVSWWENTSVHSSAETLSESVIDATFAGARWFDPHDFDKDGDLDALHCGTSADQVVWRVNNGAGNFTVEVVDGSFNGASEARAGDLDGDGDLDVAAVAFNDDDVAWYENTGTGWTKSVIGGLDFASTVRIGDVDGDGDLDIVAAGELEDEVSWWENTAGDGSAWTERLIVSSYNGAKVVDLGDIDRDGDLDVLANAFNGNEVAWFENTAGNGTAWTRTTLTTSLNGASPGQLADMDGDGDLDAVAASRGSGTVKWWANNGDGTSWVENLAVNGFGGAQSARAVDFDHDGDLDLLVAARNAAEVRWYENTDGAATSWSPHTIQTGVTDAIAADAFDIDGDGDLDVMAAGGTGLSWWELDLGELDLTGTDVGPSGLVGPAVQTALFSVDAEHVGRQDDSMVELVTLGLRFEDGAAGLHTASVVSVLFDGIWLLRDDGDGVFTAANDTEVLAESGAGFVATGGTIDLVVPDGTAGATVGLGTNELWWVVVVTGINSGIARLGSADVVLDLTVSTDEDAVEDIPLSLLAPVDVISTIQFDQAPFADAGSPYSAPEGSPIPVDGSASTDTDGTIVSYEWDCDLDGIYETFSATATTTCPAEDDDTTVTIGLLVTDNVGGYDSTTVDVTITNVAPTAVVSGPVSGDEGDTLSYLGVATDPSSADTAILAWAWEARDGSGTSVATGTAATFSVTFPDDDTYVVTGTVSDDDGGSDSQTTTVTIANVDPTISTTPTTSLLETAAWTYQPAVTDPGTEVFTWSTTTLPAAMTFDSTTGLLGWTPVLADVGSVSFTLTVDDGDGGTDSQSITLTIELLDDDNDGMGDTWELANSLDPTTNDAALDPDADGLSNLDEYTGGTDPNVYDGPDAPTLIAPIAGAEVDDALPALSWTDSTDPSGDTLTYEVQVYGDATLTTLLASATALPAGGSGTTEWTVDSSLPENADAYWRARAADPYVSGPWSSTESFFVNEVNEAPDVPVATAPLSGDRVDTLLPTLSWTESDDIDRDTVTYDVRVWNEAGDTVVAEVTGLAGASRDESWTVDVDLVEDTAYEWDARAVDEHGLESDWSTVQDFFVNTENAVPAAVVWTEPLDGDELENLSPTLRATGSTDPEGDDITYEIDLDTTASYDSGQGYSTEITQAGSGEVFWDLAADSIVLTEHTTWWARIRAVDESGGASAWAEIQVFTRGANDAPPTPELSSPDDGITVASADSIPTLVVAHVEDPEGDDVTYDVAITSDAELTDVVFSADALEPGAGPEGTDALTSTAAPTDLGAGTFYWSARAVDDLDAASEWAAARSFTIEAALGDDDDDGGEACSCESSVAGAGRPGLLMLAGLVVFGLRRRR